MRSLKINRNTLPRTQKRIIYNEVEEIICDTKNYRRFKFKCIEMHALLDGDNVVISLQKEGCYPIAHEMVVSVIDDKTFFIDFPQYQIMDVINYSSINDNALLVIKNGVIREYIKDLKHIFLKYDGEFIECEVSDSEDDAEDLTSQAIKCNRPLNFSGDGFITLYCDWFLEGNIDFQTNIDETYLSPFLVIEDRNISLNVVLTIDSDDSYGLGDEQQVVNDYYDNIIDSIIPEIVDNEKRQFSPVIRYNQNNKVAYRFADEIEINLHFRDRTDLDENNGTLTKEWKTSDEQYWNNMTVNQGWESNTENDDSMYYNTKGYDDTFADELNLLGFTEDDIKYSKTKIKRSFLRLSFYSTRSMLARDLLCYSTIHLDSGELFKKYSIIKGKGLKAFDPKRIDNDLRLSAKLRIKNQYNNSKSSEGFYLYLFPNDSGLKSGEKTIYMKAEFNHAGYGKTIPMMLPTDANGRLLKGTDKEFPLNFLIKKDGKIGPDFEKYERCMMPPLSVWYNADLGDYVYEFPFITGRKKITLNLFEPRVLGFEQ